MGDSFSDVCERLTLNLSQIAIHERLSAIFCAEPRRQ